MTNEQIIAHLIKEHHTLSNLLENASTTEARQYIKGQIKVIVETIAFIKGSNYCAVNESLAKIEA